MFAPTHPAPKSGFIPFIHAARGVAALMVVYGHLVGGFVIRFKEEWWAESGFRHYFIEPMRVSQNFGFMGVALFFVISGFVITHVVTADSRQSFLLKRFFRIFPPLWIVIGLSLILTWAGTRAGMPGYAGIPYSLNDVLLGMATLDVIVPLPRAVLGVGWTLSVEVFFYLHAALMLPLIRRRPEVAAALLTAWAWWVPAKLVRLGVANDIRPLVQLAEMIQYLPLFAVGIAACAWYSGRLRGAWLMLFVPVCLSSYSANLIWWKRWPLEVNSMFPTQAAYAIGLFFGMSQLLKDARPGRVLTWVGDISYSLYLVHLPLGLFVAVILRPYVSVAWMSAAAVMVSLMYATLSYHWIEQPAQRLARRLLARWALMPASLPPVLSAEPVRKGSAEAQPPLES